MRTNDEMDVGTNLTSRNEKSSLQSSGLIALWFIKIINNLKAWNYVAKQAKPIMYTYVVVSEQKSQ